MLIRSIKYLAREGWPPRSYPGALANVVAHFRFPRKGDLLHETSYSRFCPSCLPCDKTITNYGLRLLAERPYSTECIVTEIHSFYELTNKGKKFMATIDIVPEKSQILKFRVSPDYRRMGIGTDILNYAQQLRVAYVGGESMIGTMITPRRTMTVGDDEYVVHEKRVSADLYGFNCHSEIFKHVSGIECHHEACGSYSYTYPYKPKTD